MSVPPDHVGKALALALAGLLCGQRPCLRNATILHCNEAGRAPQSPTVAFADGDSESHHAHPRGSSPDRPVRLCRDGSFVAEALDPNGACESTRDRV